MNVLGLYEMPCATGTGQACEASERSASVMHAYLIDWFRVEWPGKHRGAVGGYRWWVTIE